MKKNQHYTDELKEKIVQHARVFDSEDNLLFLPVSYSKLLFSGRGKPSTVLFSTFSKLFSFSYCFRPAVSFAYA